MMTMGLTGLYAVYVDDRARRCDDGMCARCAMVRYVAIGMTTMDGRVSCGAGDGV